MGQFTTALIDHKTINEKEMFLSAMVTGAINCFSGIAVGMGNALVRIPEAATTSVVLANSLNAGWSVVSEVVADFLSIFISIWS